MKTPEELKIPHDLRQVGLAANEICIRDGVTVKTVKESCFGFEFFTFRSPGMVDEMSCFIDHAKGKKCLLDIGALHGLFSLVFTAINRDSRAIAFEPAEKAFEILTENFILNGKHTVPFKVALSDKKGGISMYQEWDHLVSDGNPRSEQTTLIGCMTGDSFCENHCSPDILKIDVESMELEVLKGLSQTITDNRPLIFLELHNERIINKGGSVQEVLDLLINWGYKAIDTRTNEAISFEEIAEVKNGELRLVLV